MGDMGDIFRAWEAHKKVRRADNLKEAAAFGSEGWTVHTEYHWSRQLSGSRIDYWPTKNKFRWRNRTYTGTRQDVENFVRNRETP